MDRSHEPNAPGWYARMLQTRMGMIVVTLFCMWHAFAIAMYAIPTDANMRAAVWMRSNASPIVTPYVLVTSQWQQWNMFSPNPLRRITYYKIEALSGVAWQPIVTLQPGVFPWWRHANHFKLLIGVMEGGNPQIAERYVQSFCEPFGLRPGTELQVRYLVNIIPYLEHPAGAQWWRSWRMDFRQDGEFSTQCPADPVTMMRL